MILGDTSQILVLCSGTVSTLLCLLVLWMYSRLVALGDYRPVKITTNLKIYMVIIFVDMLWSTKYVLEASFYFIGQMTAENRCKLFGFFETAYTLLQCFVTILFWVHVGAALHGYLEDQVDVDGDTEYDRVDVWCFDKSDYTIVIVVVCFSTVAAIVAAIWALAAGFIGLDDALHADGLWCWVRLHQGYFDWPPILFSYAWQALSVTVLFGGLIWPLLRNSCLQQEVNWGRSTKRALLRRAAAGVAHVVITVLSIILRYSAHTDHDTPYTTTLVVLAATIFPFNGAFDALAFLVSEPGLLTALTRRTAVAEEMGFINAVEELKSITRNAQDYGRI